MGFKCGLVGLPNSGKSTIFNALTCLHVEASAYPFCTIDPHVGIIPIEDSRLDIVNQAAGSQKKVPTTIEFVDIAGLVKGASQGEGMGNQFLSHITRSDAIAHVVRCFEEGNVSHTYQTLDPERDAGVVTLELILKDLEILEKRLGKTINAAKSGDSRFRHEVEALESLQAHLSSGGEIRHMNLTETQERLVHEMNLLSAKPVMFIANTDEHHLKDSTLVNTLTRYAERAGAPCIVFCGKVQAEIAELDPEDQAAFLGAMGLDETGLQKLAKTGYGLLNLISFFTANENEAHA